MATTEQTVQYSVRVPLSLAEASRERASQLRPGVSRAGSVRLALARLAGLPDDLADDIPPGPKPPRSAAT